MTADKRLEAPQRKRDPLQPTLSLLSKLGSITVHAQELLSPGGHDYDLIALKALLQDREVQEWLREMKVYIPVKR